MRCGWDVPQGCSTAAQHKHVGCQKHCTPGCCCCLLEENKLTFQLSHIVLEMCNRTSAAPHETCTWRPDKAWLGREGKQHEAGVHSIIKDSSQHRALLEDSLQL